MKAWFQADARDLPWRRTRDPFAILVSEVMLQQTTVAAVLAGGRYGRFLERFPDWPTLAAATDEDVMAEWAGLGYYSRARNLHAAAKHVVEHHGGVLPPDLQAIRQLPGVGRYTAGAVASFAFGLRVPLVDTNVARVLARLHAIAEPLNEPATQRELWARAEALLEPDGETTRTQNAALMELGALICRPADPACAICPLANVCRSQKQGLTGSIPATKAKPPVLQRHLVALAIRRPDGCLLLRRAPKGEWHAGLLVLPGQLFDAPPSATAHRRSQFFHAALRPAAPPLTQRFVVTRHRVEMDVHPLELPEGGFGPWNHPAGAEFEWSPHSGAPHRLVWHPLDQLAGKGLGAPYLKVASRLHPPDSPDLFHP